MDVSLPGVTAGDHAAIIWPLLIGMAKSKYYLLTADRISGREAERMGLVSVCVPDDQLMDKAWEIGNRLAQGSQPAIRGTKRTLNNWLRLAGPIFDASLALEMVDFLGRDAAEAMRALKERRRLDFHPHNRIAERDNRGEWPFATCSICDWSGQRYRPCHSNSFCPGGCAGGRRRH